MIKSIDFNGLKNIKERDLATILNSYLGQIYSNEVFDKLQVDLYALDYFDGLIRPEFKVDDDKLFITFFVKEKSLVKTVSFVDNSKVFWNSELRDKSNVKINESLNLANVKRSVIKFEEMYRELGILMFLLNMRLRKKII